MSSAHRWPVYALLVGALLLAGCSPPRAVPPPTPTRIAIAQIGNAEDRMAAPVMPADPTQADQGAKQYWLHCMTCHGDRGQGLTDEWRAAWGEDMDCWKSKCHASNHPPEGFELLHFAPLIIGPGALGRFETAQELYDYVSAEMPWWNPGMLETQENWQVVAYLLRENDVQFEGPIDESNADQIRLH